MTYSWPDGQYTAPGEAALISDVSVLKDWGLNLIRLHQKTNPERWYYVRKLHKQATVACD